jgi:hypothetical protein
VTDRSPDSMQFACEPAKQFVSRFIGLCSQVRWLTSELWLQSIITTSFIEASTTPLPSGGPFSMCFKSLFGLNRAFLIDHHTAAV